MRWYFETTDEDTVWLSSRIEDGEVIGDAHAEVGPGEDFFGLSYEELKKVGGGVIELPEEGDAKIVDDDDDDEPGG